MFEMKKWWKNLLAKMTPSPEPESLAAPQIDPPVEPIKADAPAVRRGRGGWNRKYNSPRERVAAWRSKQRALKAAVAEQDTPEPVVESAPLVAPESTVEPTKPPSFIQDAAWDWLLRPGSKTTLPAPAVESAEPEAVTSPEPTPEAVPENPDTRPVDWNEERQINLPVRTPGRIQFLLRFESPEQTRARILNDQARYLWERRGSMPNNPQSAIVSANVPWSSKTVFVKR